MRGPHDIGGEAAGPVDTSLHEPEPWQKLVTALSGVLGSGRHNIICTDETRRTREALDQETYDAGYFERHTQSLADLLVEKGLLEPEAITRRMAEIEKRINEFGR
ncbi:MAG: nitrile hydratase subunit beta [Alphaproteobacteria bacterium]|nr:MAG: nitrile hydratase subunit beta [Alphaproteobacteria bacterium]